MSVIAKNPILSGFYPDPSICAVGEDYYIVNSTFAYFPGIPVLHSKDLSHWEQIGNVMERETQLPLKHSGHSQGLFAPAIRFHDGMFYVICTNVSGRGNFIVTAQSPEGPWSEPYYLEDADGIDPSLFFDEDGTCYYIGTHPNPEGCKHNGDWYIWIQELDIKKMCLTGERHDVWNGSMRGVIWPEGPHIYKKDGYYYIMHAEGGTGPDHAVSICRSKEIFGPYENNPKNPILTHRHMGKKYPVKYVGHGDLFEVPHGEWYMVMLAVRPLEGYTTLGRETFLAKVEWEDGWPIVNPGIGKLEQEVLVQLPEWKPELDPESYTCKTKGKNALPGSDRIYEFGSMAVLGDEFLMLRNPLPDQYELLENQGLKLCAGKATLKEEESPSYVAVRQQHHKFTVSAQADISGLKGTECAGIALMQSNQYHLRVEVDDMEIRVILCRAGQDEIKKCIPLPSKRDKFIDLFLEVDGLTAEAGVRMADLETGQTVNIACLSTETAGGFVGCTVGVYATSGGTEPEGYALFKNFQYTHKEEEGSGQ